MDLDAFVTEHRAEWERLRQLAGARRRKLTPTEVDELVVLYQRATTHLSMVRSQAPDPALVAWLSRLVLRARASLTPARTPSPADFSRFLLVTFPGEVYRAGGWWIGVAVLFSVLAGIRMAVVAADPTQFLPQARIEELVEYAFEDYYSTYQPQNFMVGVWTNNAYLAAICLAAGILIVPAVLVLWYNAENIGVVGGAMIGSGRADLFFSLVLVHGLLELTAIFVAAGVGLRIGWAWIAPGPERTRAQAVAQRARSGMVVALGIGLVLLVSAGIEAFVTPAPVPIALRLAAGVVVWLVFLAYIAYFGALAVRGKQTADVDSFDRPAEVPTAGDRPPG